MTMIQMQTENVDEVRQHFDAITAQIQEAYSHVYEALTKRKIDREAVILQFRNDMNNILGTFQEAAGAVDATFTDLLAAFELMDVENQELGAMRQLVETANTYILPIEVMS